MAEALTLAIDLIRQRDPADFEPQPRRGEAAIVVGGGLIGLLSAAELHLAGFDVTVLEAGPRVAGRASWAGGGILCPLSPWQESAAVWALARRSQARTEAWVRGPLAAMDVALEFWRCGIEWRDLDAAALAWVQCEFPAAQMRRPGAVYVDEIAQIRTPRYGQAMLHWLQARGVDVLCNTPVAEVVFGHADAAPAVITQSGQSLEASAVVVASGAWAGELLPSYATTPVRGQMLRLAARDALGHPPEAIICSGHEYVIPRRDGSVLVGSTREHAGFDAEPTDAGHAQLRAIAGRLVPGLERAALLDHWAGLRPALGHAAGPADPAIGPAVGAGDKDIRRPDGTPGQATSNNGVWVNAGHFANGVTLAAASAECLTYQIRAARR